MQADIATPRARAAWAYSGLDQRELAARAELNYDRLRAILSLSNKTSVHSEELEQIAEAAGVPQWFMKHDWNPPSKQTGDDKRLNRLEAQVTQLRAGLVALAAGNLQRTQALLSQLERDHPGTPAGDTD